MRIIVDIRLGEDGRPTGTVRAEEDTEGRPFSGNLEFLALVEGLYRSETRPNGSGTDDDSTRRQQ